MVSESIQRIQAVMVSWSKQILQNIRDEMVSLGMLGKYVRMLAAAWGRAWMTR